MKLEYRGSGDELEIAFPSQPWQKILTATNLTPIEGAAVCAWVAAQWKRMPHADPVGASLPNLFTEPQTQQVTFYPGSFNPWHEGHSACVSLTPSSSTSPIIVVPDSNPWKDSSKTKQLCPWNEILQLAKRLSPKVVVYPGFWASDKKNPTVDWLPMTHWQHRNLTVGADSFLALPRWKEVAKLLGSIEKLFVVPRNIELKNIEMTKKEILKLVPKLEVQILPGHEFESVSSSGFRK